MPTTLTTQNLKAIQIAMDQIKPNDQSENFKKYYQEVIHRIAALEKDEKYLEKVPYWIR